MGKEVRPLANIKTSRKKEVIIGVGMSNETKQKLDWLSRYPYYDAGISHTVRVLIEEEYKKQGGPVDNGEVDSGKQPTVND